MHQSYIELHKMLFLDIHSNSPATLKPIVELLRVYKLFMIFIFISFLFLGFISVCLNVFVYLQSVFMNIKII